MLLLQMYPGSDNMLTLLVRVHDVPTVGDPSLLARLTSRSDAVSRLRNAVRGSQFRVSAANVNNVQAQSDSFSSSSESADTGTTYSPGEVAGIAIGVLVGGLLVGAVVVFLITRRRRRTNPSAHYQKERV